MTTHPKREYTPEEIEALVAALRNTPNWHRETFGAWKDMTYVGDNSPFKAADMLESLASQLAAQKREDVSYLVEALRLISGMTGGSVGETAARALLKWENGTP